MSTDPPRTIASGLRPGGRHDAWRPEPPIGWVLLDVDGTLVGPTGVVTPPVVEAARTVAAAGIRVGYATGRNREGVRDVHGALGLAGPHIVLNGAQVRHDGQALHTWALTAEQIRAILDLCEAEGRYAELYTGDGYLVTALDRRYQPHWELVIGWPRGTVADHPEALAEVIKATIVATGDADRDHVVAAVRSLGLNAGAATSPLTPGFTYVNITRGDAHKGTALQATARGLGLSASQVVVVGDGANDLPMLAVAGTAIAMGDADPVVHQAAHLVTGGMAADGAAEALLDVLRWGS